MYRNIKKTILIVLALSFFFSCKKVMDTQPFDKLPAEQAFASRESVEAVLAQCYADVLDSYSKQYAGMESYTPNGIHSDLTVRDNFPCEININANNWDAGMGRFTQLRRLNLVITNVEKSAFLDEKTKKELIATATFLRGLLYFDMTRKMGRFVPVNQLFELSDSAKMKILLTKNAEESYTYIMNDINASIENLPQKADGGKITKYAALAFKSRIALQAYAYTGNAQYLEQCLSAANDVIKNGGYLLTSNYENMFLFQGKNDNEIILNRQYLSLNSNVGSFNEMISAVPNVKEDDIKGSEGSPLLQNLKGLTFECWASYFPTQELVDQYLVIDKKDGKAKSLYQTSQYTENVTEIPVSELKKNAFTESPTGKTIGYHSVPEEGDLGSNAKGNIMLKYGKVTTKERINDIMYQNRDKRFYATIVYDSSFWLANELVTLCVQGNLWAGVRQGKSSSWYTTVSGYYWRKAVANVEPRLYYTNPTDFQYVLIRLGEMYMNLAEALLLKNDIAGAVEALNKTRTTHGALPPSTASSLEEAWADYIRERRCEMAYEGDLYWSYLRWGKYGGYANHGEAPGAVIKDLNVPVSKIQIKKNRKEFFIGQIHINNSWDRNFSVKRYLYPIPNSFLNNRAAYGIKDEQNPGWQ